MRAARGWWVDNRGASRAHFYREDDLIPECEILAVWPLCGVEPPETSDPREYLHLPGETEPRPYADMGDATGSPCLECLRLLAAST